MLCAALEKRGGESRRKLYASLKKKKKKAQKTIKYTLSNMGNHTSSIIFNKLYILKWFLNLRYFSKKPKKKMEDSATDKYTYKHTSLTIDAYRSCMI